MGSFNTDDHDKKATMAYYHPDEYGNPRPYSVKSYKSIYAKRSPREVVIRNMRNLSETFSLDVQGFELHTYPSKELENLDDDEVIKGRYYDECIELMKTV